MLPEPLPPPLDQAPPAPKTGLAGPRALVLTQAIALAAAGVLGAVLVIGIPLLLRQQGEVSAALSVASAATRAVDGLTLLHWIVLVLVAATSICLVVAVMRLLRHAQSQDAVRKEAQALLLRAERARMDADQANA